MADADVDLALVNSAVTNSQLWSRFRSRLLTLQVSLGASQVPAIAITETFVVADIAARDALVIGAQQMGKVQEGDVAVVTDASAGCSG